MCERCDKVEQMVSDVNAGKREFDREVVLAVVMQNVHVMEEMAEQLSDESVSVVECLRDCTATFMGLSIALEHNGMMIARALHHELQRIAHIATQN